MSMQSRILRDSTGNITIQMEGSMDYEFSIPFRNEVMRLAQENPYSSITMDLGGIDFVGASGICHFVETIKLLKDSTENNVGLSNVRSEFVKVFKLYNLEEQNLMVELFDMESDSTDDLGQRFANRRRTFEN